jgi:hypothetical protein
VSLRNALVLSLALALGCSVFKPQGPSEVARGEYYAAGKPQFDRFFIELYELQVSLAQAPTEPTAARKTLTDLLGLPVEASDDSLHDRLTQEARKLAGLGLKLRLDVPEASTKDDASATLYTNESSTSTPLRASLPEQATRLVRSRNAMLKAKSQLEALAVLGIQLDGSVDATFHTEGPWKRDEVRTNLSDAQKVITLMQARAREIRDSDDKLLAELTSAASTDGSLGKLPAISAPAAEEAPRQARRGGSAARSGAAPTHAAAGPTPVHAAAPPPAAKAPPKHGGDDEAPPAPKPTQGSAPAEIEP